MTDLPTQQPHIVLTGGGTGGHLFPGLATAERLRGFRPDLAITIAGTGPGGFARRIHDAGCRYLPLSCRPFSTRPLGLFRFIVSNAAAYWAASRFLARNPVAAVVGLGGYASVPMARAAAARGIPLVLLEQNAVPGKATRFLACHARAVCLAFAESRAAFRADCPIHLTGNPVREGFTIPAASPRVCPKTGTGSRTLCRVPNANTTCRVPVPLFGKTLGGRPQLLVLGGSGGSQALNQTVPVVLAGLRDSLAGWHIVHQTGTRDAEATRLRYAATGLHATVLPWLDDMPGVMRQSSIAISRAGGTTLAELAATGLPAVLVPYPHAAADHQRANARAYWSAGAAEVVEQKDTPVAFPQALNDALAHLLVHPSRRKEMREAMLLQARPAAAEEIARLILQTAGIQPECMRLDDRTPSECGTQILPL